MSTEKMREAFLTWWWHDDQREMRQSCAEGWGIYIWSASRASIELDLSDWYLDGCCQSIEIEKARSSIESIGLKVKP